MATAAHCHYCFDTLAAHLEHRKALTLAQIEALLREQTRSANGTATNGVNGVNGTNGTNGTNGVNGHTAPVPRPLFVTWNKRSRSGSKNLRGCIGTFEAQPLDHGLRSYALTAALDDTRFNPITLKELPSLECGVTLLTDFEPASSTMDWELGVHGLRINFVYHGKRMGATYLPDVPVEQEWSKEETVVSLMRKAGWTGRKEEWRKVQVEVVRYRGTRATVGWEDYRELREKAGGLEEEDEDEDEEGDEDEDEED